MFQTVILKRVRTMNFRAVIRSNPWFRLRPCSPPLAAVFADSILILLVVTLFGTGCSSMKSKPNEDGFHAPQAFQYLPPSAPLLKREEVFASNRITVNKLGFQVGF